MDPLFGVVADLAKRHNLGTVGIAGAHALGTTQKDNWHRLEILLRGPLERADAFGRELAEAAQLRVDLHDVERLPWASHLHLAVRWLNVDRLPRVQYPRGAVAEVTIGELSGRVPFANVPHLHAIDGPPPTPPPGRATMTHYAPIGGFLL